MISVLTYILLTVNEGMISYAKFLPNGNVFNIVGKVIVELELP